VELVGWETHAWPGFGEDAQDVINRQIEPYEIFVGVMWKRLGTPTGRAASGTVEEFTRAYERWGVHRVPHLMFYFSRAPIDPRQDDMAQAKAVVDFQQHLQALGGFVREYAGIKDFRQKVYRDLYRQLTDTRGDPADDLPQPTDSGVFDVPSHARVVSRDRALDRLEAVCARSPVVALEGLSGSGKTFLLADFLKRAGTDNSTYWYDATPGSTVDDALSLLARRLRFSGSSNLTKAKELVHHLEESDRRLVIDAYHLGDRDSFIPLLEAASHRKPPARVLLVSREHVRLPPALPANARLTISGLDRGEIAAMLRTRGFSTVADRWVSGLQTKAGGLPLAVTLFSSAVDDGRDPDELLAGPVIGIENQLRDWLDEVVAGLPPEGRPLLRFLSTALGPFNRGVVRMACRALELDDADEPFNALQRCHLVEDHTPYRWSVHQLLAEFSRMELEPDELARVHEAYGKHYQRLGQEWPGQPLDDDTFAQRLIAARHLQLAGRRRDVQKLLGRLSRTAKVHGHYASFMRLCETELEDENRDPWIDYHFAHCCMITGRLSAAGRVLRCVPPTENRNLTLSLARLEAELLLALGDGRRALRVLADAMDGAEHSVKAAVLAQMRGLEARILLAVGDPEAAAQIATRLMARAHERDDDLSAAVAFTYLGFADLARGRASEARGSFAAAVERFRDEEDRRGVAWALTGRADAKLQLGDRDGAILDIREALVIKSDLAECSTEYLRFLERLRDEFVLVDSAKLVHEELDRVGRTMGDERRKALLQYAAR